MLARIRRKVADARQIEQGPPEVPIAITPLMQSFFDFASDPTTKGKLVRGCEAGGGSIREQMKRGHGRLTTAEVKHTLRLLQQNQYSWDYISAEVGICASSVANVKKRAKKDPDYLKKLSEEHEGQVRVKECSLALINEKLAAGAPIWHVAQL